MKRNMAAFVAAAMLLLVATAAFGAKGTVEKFVKQVGGGSTGDSLTAAADTSTAETVHQNATGWRAFAAADSASIYTTQVSENKSNWFIIDIDTVAAGEAESSADFGNAYAGFWVRVIMEPIPGASPYGAAFIITTTP